MTDTASFKVDFDVTDARANVEALEDTTTRAFGQMEQSTASLSTAFTAVGSVLTTVGTVATATYGAIAVLVQTTTQAVVETDNYANTLGISTEAMQTFEFALTRAGGEADALREGMRTAQEGVAEFVNAGSGPATEALQVLGVQLTDTSGRVRSMEQLFPELVTALGSVQDPAERTRLAIQLFGEEDSVLIATMGQNPRVFDEARSALERYGLVMGQDLVGKSRQFQTGVTDLLASLQGLGQELVAALLPTLNQLLPQFTAWVASLRESDTVQKELIPTIQAIIGYLGEIGPLVEVLQDAWRGLNVAFNAVVMAILEGVGTIAQGLGTIITAAGQAADFLGMDGVAEKLQSAGAAVTAVGEEADRMGDIARETMQEWQQSLNDTTDSLGTTKTATQDLTTSTTQLGTTATQTGTQVTDATRAMTAETAQHRQALLETNKAYADLGIQSGEALKKLADEAVKDFETIRQSGTETPERLAAIWTEQVIPTIIDAYQQMPEKFDEADKQILAGAQQTTTDITRAYETLGIEAPEAMKKMAAEILDAFKTIVDSGTRNWEELRTIYVEQVVPAIEAATGKIAPAFETAMGIVKQSATDSGDHVQKVFDATGKAVEGTMSSLGKLLEQLGIQTTEQLRTTAAAAESNLLTIVNIYGVRSKEAAQAFAETIQDIKAYHDELPPHIQRIADQILGSHERAAAGSEQVHRQAVQRIVQVYSDGFTRINGIIQATTGEIETGGFQWGTTLEALQAQLQQTQQEYTNWSRAVGVDSQLVQFQLERLREIINELQQRIAALQGQQTAATSTTDRLADSLTRAGTAGSTIASGLDSVTASATRSRTEITALGAALHHTMGISDEWLARYGSHHPLRGQDLDYTGNSLTIGLPPASLPPGVPLPSDLGLDQGGVRYDPYATPFLAGGTRQPTPTVTNQTIVNVQEPITIQTRADTSALTTQAVMEGLNDAVRRGVLQPQLSQPLQRALRRGRI